MKLVYMLKRFLEKFRILTFKEQQVIQNIRADIGRKKEYKRSDGFISVPDERNINMQKFIYEPALDKRLKKIRRTGPYFRIWFTQEKNGNIYLVDFEKLD